MIRINRPSPRQVGDQFVRQYYALQSKAPDVMYRFYCANSSYVHGSGYAHDVEEEEVIGQIEILKKIQSLNVKDLYTKLYQIDAHGTIGNGVVVQVIGEFSNNRKPLKRFTQTFVLAPCGDDRYKFYVRNDIFHDEEEIFRDDLTSERQGEEEHASDPDVDDKPEHNKIQPINCNDGKDDVSKKDDKPEPNKIQPINCNDGKDDVSKKDVSSPVTSWAAVVAKTPAKHTFRQRTVGKMNKAREIQNVDQAQKPAKIPLRTKPHPQKDDSRDAGSDMGGRRGTRYPDNQQIFVGILPHDITENDLREHFAEFGLVIDVRIIHSRTSNRSCAFVTFDDAKAVEEVLRQMPTSFKNNKRIIIEEIKKRGLQRDGRRGPIVRDNRKDNNRGGRLQNRGPPTKE